MFAATFSVSSNVSAVGYHTCMMFLYDVVMPSQNARSLSTRLAGGFPAITAQLMAPTEIPATQLGWMPASASAS